MASMYAHARWGAASSTVRAQQVLCGQTHTFDASVAACGDGLADEGRRRGPAALGEPQQGHGREHLEERTGIQVSVFTFDAREAA